MTYIIQFLIIYIMINGIVKISNDIVTLYKWITKKLKKGAE